MTLRMVLVLVVAHFVADFVAQTDWQAMNKSKRWDALAVHVSVYSLVVTALVGLSGSLVNLALWGAANAVTHFAQDAITSRINALLWFIRETPTGETGQVWFGGAGGGSRWVPFSYVEHRNTRHWFFVGIGADQMLHYVTLFITASWWLQ